MLNDRQKNFYDEKRQFQGKDDPGIAHPDARILAGPSIAQLIFGVFLIGALVAMAIMREKSVGHEGHEETPHAAPAATTTPAAPVAPAGH